MNTQIYIEDNLIHPETTTDLIIHNNSNAKDILDKNTSDFGRKILNAQSFAEVCRLLHHNYTFAKDSIDEVEWTITGAPSADSTHAKTGSALHATNGNYIYRKLNFGGDSSFTVEFDCYCNEANKIFFQIFDNTALPADNVKTAATRRWYRLTTDANGYVGARYVYQISRDYNSSAAYQWDWGNAAVTDNTLESNFKLNSVKHIKIEYTHTNQIFKVYVDGSSLGDLDRSVANKNWLVYLGYTAECWIDNFAMTFNGVDISALDFE